MSIFTKIFKNEKKNKNQDMIALGLNRNSNFCTNYNELFKSNYCVNRALNLIASNISKLKLVVTHNGIFEQDDVVLKLLNNSNNDCFLSDFLEKFVLQYLIYGNVFLYFDEKNTKLVLIDMQNIEIYQKNNQIFYSFIYNNEKIVVASGSDNFGHMKNFNPSSDLFGYSFLEPIKSSALLYQYIDEYNLNFLQNGARPSGILTIKGDYSTEEAETMKLQFYKEYSGENQAGKIIFLNKEFVWQPLSNNNKDMDYTDASRRTIRAIASGLGVPAILLGDLSLAGEASRNNLDAIFDVFYQTTIIPLANKIAQFLSMFFSRGDNMINIAFIKENENKINSELVCE